MTSYFDFEANPIGAAACRDFARMVMQEWPAISDMTGPEIEAMAVKAGLLLADGSEFKRHRVIALPAEDQQ